MNTLVSRVLALFRSDRQVGDREPTARRASDLRIFISYRRSDSAAFAGRISDRLSAHFGGNSVFVDIDNIPLGVDFSSALKQEIAVCDVVLALIGPTWLARLGESTDWLRIELETALALDKVIVPLLLGDTRMPVPQEVPTSLVPILYRNAISVDQGTSFHRDVDILIQSLERLTPQSSVPRNDVKPQAKRLEIEVDDSTKSRVFLSHATLDRDWVEAEIVTLLSGAGISCWYARTDIRTSQQWEREILKGMESCGWFLLVASPRSSNSEWVKDELFWAMQYRPSTIITVMMEACDLYQFHLRLPRLQYVSYEEVSRSEARDAIVRTIRSG